MGIAFNEDPDSAEWVRTPGSALAHYLSLTFEEQTALAFVVDWHRRHVRKRMAEMVEQIQREY